MELAFEHAVGATHLLLLAQLHAHPREFARARGAVLTGAGVPAFDGALAAHAALALEKQLSAFTSAELADWASISGHK
jgi:hypothetical protein